MTTIAYKDGVIAADGRITSGDIIATDKRVKRYELSNGVMFLAGNDSALDEIEARGSLSVGDNLNEDTFNALFVDHNSNVYICGADGGIVWMSRCRDKDSNEAIGSGGAWALAAMDLGKTAKEAVEYAATRDKNTGGVISEWRINGDI